MNIHINISTAINVHRSKVTSPTTIEANLTRTQLKKFQSKVANLHFSFLIDSQLNNFSKVGSELETAS